MSIGFSLLKTTTHTLTSAAQSTRLRGLSLCHCVVSIAALLFKAYPTSTGTFAQAGLRPTLNVTTTALNRQSMSFKADRQLDCGKAPQCAFVERLSTSRGACAIGFCPVASLLACWAAP
jgi:hypothetical protein